MNNYELTKEEKAYLDYLDEKNMNKKEEFNLNGIYFLIKVI